MMGKFNTDLAAWSVFSLPEIQIVKKSTDNFQKLTTKYRQNSLHVGYNAGERTKQPNTTLDLARHKTSCLDTLHRQFTGYCLPVHWMSATMTLTFQGHLMSSFTWPLDSP